MLRETLIRQGALRPHPERDGDFRWRGDGVSRIEGLSDAVFGFAITLLVVSLEVPRTFDALARLLVAFPAFAGSFALLVLIWFAQYRFFRRYGLEDGRTIVLNVGLLFVVVFFIYPLKFLFSTFIGLWLGAVGMLFDAPALAAEGRAAFGALRPAQWPILLAVYSAGYVSVFALLWAMHRHALRCADALDLDARERHFTRATMAEQATHIAVAVVACAVVLLAAYGPFALPVPRYFTRPGFAAMLGGFCFALEWPAQALVARRWHRAAPPPTTGERPAVALPASTGVLPGAPRADVPSSVSP